MSFANHSRGNSSVQSLGNPDLSLGSLISDFSTPAKSFRIPSTSSVTIAPSTAPLTTPSPPQHASHLRRNSKSRIDEVTATPVARRRLASHDEEAGDETQDILGTARKAPEDLAESALNGRGKRSRAGGAAAGKSVNLTLRDQEKHIDNLKKENFNIKLKVHFLEERLAQLAPDQIDAALKQNINLKIEVQQRGMDLKKLRKLVLELEKELERSQKNGGGSGGGGQGGSSRRERELEEMLQERDREIRELRRRRVESSQDVDEELEIALRDAEDRNQELENELTNMKDLLMDNSEELDRLKNELQRREDSSFAGEEGEARKDRMRRRLAELEAENEDLKAALEEHADMVALRDDEKEDLMDQMETLRLEIEDLQRRREAESIERSESRAQIYEEREEREAMQDGLNELRDKLAAATIELQQKDDELEFKQQEVADLLNEHNTILEEIDETWRVEVDEGKAQVEELRDALAERDSECEELRMHVAELESNTNDLHEKFEIALANLEKESDEKDEEIAAANREVEQLGHRIYELEEEHDELKKLNDRLREDEAVDRERLEALTEALKGKLASTKRDLDEMTQMYENAKHDIGAHRERQEELARHVEDLVEEVRKEREDREHLEGEFDKADREHDAELRREQRALEAKESAFNNALSDLDRTRSLLAQRDADLAALQSALQSMEAESKKLGESHTTARFSLQLEVDRMKRDLERLEDELTRARKDLDDRETKSRERDGLVDTLHAENRELAAQLATQTQARLNLSEKLDSTKASLTASETELASLRSKMHDLEQRLSKDQRSLLVAESQYRDQLTERNTLLLTIYQYMDKILGVDKTPKKGGQAETKPFTNFSVFHDNLITRLKSLSQIQLQFDQRVKDAETRYAEKLCEIKKQLDNRWKQIDKFEGSLKTYADTKSTWRRKMNAKDGEIEAMRASNAELTAQLSSMRRPGVGDSNEIRALQARATNAERRLTNAQNQLASAEEKMANMNQKTTVADTKWEARVKEYETRLRAAEEKVKREKQGYKERIVELETQIKSLQRQRELADKRIQQISDIENNVRSPRSPTMR